MKRPTYYQTFFQYVIKFCFLSLGFIGLNSSAQAETPKIIKDAPAILVLGDSLSSGHGLKADSGWVTLLDNKLKAHDSKYKVINASVSGDTTSNGLSKLPKLLDTHKPQIVILELGANDGLRGIDISVTKNNLKQMISLSKNKNTQTLLIRMRVPPNYGMDYFSDFNKMFTDLAFEEKVPMVEDFIDTVQRDSSLLQKDNFHPNEQAQIIMLNSVWPKLSIFLR